MFKLGPFAPGKRYEATLTYDAGTDIGYAMAWVDGDPSGKDFASFVGIGTGTGTRELQGKEDKFLFTVDAKSTAAFLYLVVRSNKPWKLGVGSHGPAVGSEPQLAGHVGLLLRDRFRRRSDVAVPAHPRAAQLPRSRKSRASEYADVAPGREERVSTTARAGPGCRPTSAVPMPSTRCSVSDRSPRAGATKRR